MCTNYLLTFLLHHMLVHDVMRTELTLFTPDMRFREVIKEFLDKDMESTAVVEHAESKKLVGVISLFDLIERLVPEYLETDPTAAVFEAEDFFRNAVEKVADTPVQEVMKAPVHFVHPNHTLIEVATLISKFKLRSVPVLQEGTDTIVGYVSRRDLKEAMGTVLGLR